MNLHWLGGIYLTSAWFSVLCVAQAMIWAFVGSRMICMKRPFNRDDKVELLAISIVAFIILCYAMQTHRVLVLGY